LPYSSPFSSLEPAFVEARLQILLDRPEQSLTKLFTGMDGDRRMAGATPNPEMRSALANFLTSEALQDLAQLVVFQSLKMNPTFMSVNSS
jgi:hypothetical protein